VDNVEDSPTQTREETTSGLCADTVGETSHFCVFNDTLIGYSGQTALRRDQCGIFAQSKNCGAKETATAR
jgi:hypothetical protein